MTDSAVVDEITDSEIWANTILFSNQPQNSFNVFIPSCSSYNDAFVVNYSELYEEYVTNNTDSELSARYEEKLTHPSCICTGDILQASEYRGVGAYYAVWLHANSYQNPDSWKLSSAASLNKKDRREELDGVKKFVPPFPVYSLGLDEDVMMKIQEIITRNQYNTWKSKVEEFLNEKGIIQPVLLEKLEKDPFELSAAFNSLRFKRTSSNGVVEGKQDEDEEAAADAAWAKLIDDEDWLDPLSGEVQEADKYVEKPLRSVQHPFLKLRHELAQLQKKPWMQLYLFQCSDEFGYNAPIAVSMAPKDYFPREYGNRDVDVTLLPPPVLSKTTFFGPIVSRMQQTLIEQVEDWDEERTVAIFDTEAENLVFWRTPDDVFDCGETGEQSPVIMTRNIFHSHAVHMRERMKEEMENGNIVPSDEKSRVEWFDKVLF